MTEAEWRDVWQGIVRGVVILASLAMAAFHFLLVEWGRGMLAFGGPRGPMTWFDYWFEHFGYGILATVVLLLPWLQPWTGYVALLIGIMAFVFGARAFLTGIGLVYVGYALVILFGFWQLVGFQRFLSKNGNRGGPRAGGRRL